MRSLKKPSSISRVRLDDSRFTLGDIPINRFVKLGRQSKDASIVHTAYVRKPSLGSTCYTHPKVKLTGYCSYSLVSCESIGILGAIFYTYKERTRIHPNYLVISRHVSESLHDEVFSPVFTLERLDLLAYPSNCGSVIVVPTTMLDVSLLVQVG